MGPGWCGSVDWVPAFKPKGRRFYSQAEHMPGLWARSPVRGHVRGNHTLMFLSLSFSLPSSPSKNKEIKSFLKNGKLDSGWWWCISFGLWVFTSVPTVWWGRWLWGSVQVGAEGTLGISAPSLQFWCEPKTDLKKWSLFFREGKPF